MARGQRIVVSSEPEPSNYGEGIVGATQTFFPGMVVQKDLSVALQGGSFTYKPYSPGASGDPSVGAPSVVIENVYLGKTMLDSYAAGERFFFYTPEPGNELNLLIKNLSGTADSHAAGERLMLDNTTGKLIVTDGTRQKEVALLQETLAALTADTLAWCEWRGN